jgi:hypothetical protein
VHAQGSEEDMSDDWAKKYVAEHTRTREVARRKDEESQKRREYAEAGR